MTYRTEGVAIVVGAGEGIGRACALRLAEGGADVVVAARREAPLRALAESLAAETGRRVLPIPMDLARVEQCTGLVERAVEELGRVDSVVNVATAGSARAPVEKSDWDDWRQAFEVNVVGTLEVSRAAARRMKEQGGGGSIVQIGSIGLQALRRSLGSYTSTKSAMIVASRTLAREMGPHGVRVNVVTPGYVTGPPLTANFQALADRTGQELDAVVRQAASTAALRRHVDPEDIAAVVQFLCSDAARNVTGVEIPVDAGQILGG
ncbi:MAG: SDR family oxidoreductase [Proteobacteria bacterium]|nr:SDR family oxidoreductase [Pseudomonadota bacterium]